MADPLQPSLFDSLKKLGRSLVELGRAFQGKKSGTSYVDPLNVQRELPLALPSPHSHFEDAQLLTQHTPGWHVPKPARLPVPTYAPVMTAFAIVLLALGPVTMWIVSVVGGVLFIAAIAKWIGELLHD